jgi:hypothetical protein
MPQKDPNITELVETFASSITAAVEASIAQRIQAAIADAFGAPPKRGPGRPPKPTAAPSAPATPSAPAAPTAKKKTRPKQLCPVPGCKNSAAPVFGMVCGDHRNVAKSKIQKYRADRKGNATVATAAKAAPAKKSAPASPKVARARKLQGKYLGAMRALTGDDRARVKLVAQEKGVAEAVKLAMTLKKSKG